MQAKQVFVLILWLFFEEKGARSPLTKMFYLMHGFIFALMSVTSRCVSVQPLQHCPDRRTRITVDTPRALHGSREILVAWPGLLERLQPRVWLSRSSQT
jgi:hypothetical protein